FVARLGPVAIVDLETTGLQTEPDAEILELGAVLIDPGAARVRTAHALVRTRLPLPRAVARLTGLREEDLAGAPPIAAPAAALPELPAGRPPVAAHAASESLASLALRSAPHPDAPDLRLESFTRMLLGGEERHRALEDALDTARVIAAAGAGAAGREARSRVAARALESFAPDSPWLALLGKEELPTPLPEP